MPRTRRAGSSQRAAHDAAEPVSHRLGPPLAYDDGVLNHPLLFLEHLSAQDVDVLAAVAGTGSGRTDFRNELSRQPEAIDGFLADPALFDAVFENPVGGINAQVTPLSRLRHPRQSLDE